MQQIALDLQHHVRAQSTNVVMNEVAKVYVARAIATNRTARTAKPDGHTGVEGEPAMARQLVGQRSRREIWEGFLNDTTLLAKFQVTDDEIAILRTFAPFGTLSGSEDILFILERIRRSRSRW
jgi:hypothetical protein